LPQHKSAAKAWRQSLNRRMRNKAMKTRIKNTVKKFLATLETGTVEEAEAAFRQAQSIIQRAVSKGTLHWRTAARKISRLSTRLEAKKSAGKEA